eukprot:COSAG06_NODE_1909_length_8084_cov_66.552536_4_plen_81_part_00
MIILPRQARDKHRKTQERDAFSCSEHVRETPTPKSGDKKRKASELAAVAEEEGRAMAVDAAEEPAAAVRRIQRAVFIAMP